MIVVIPARYGSKRLPGKALLDIKGKSLVQRVYECAKQSRAERIIIATDDSRIEQASTGFGAEVCMTSDKHNSGTERLAEVVKKLGIDSDEIIVNLQGDEPLMPGVLIDQVADTLENSNAPMATACHEIETREEAIDPHVVKVILDTKGNAIYFSRATIPYIREDPDINHLPVNTFYRHVGIYAYRAGFLETYTGWPPCSIEQHESLEQLRVLWHGEKIAVCNACELPGPGVDTQEDLDKVMNMV